MVATAQYPLPTPLLWLLELNLIKPTKAKRYNVDLQVFDFFLVCLISSQILSPQMKYTRLQMPLQQTRPNKIHVI
jgi:hypothetical protein